MPKKVPTTHTSPSPYTLIKCVGAQSNPTFFLHYTVQKNGEYLLFLLKTVVSIKIKSFKSEEYLNNLINCKQTQKSSVWFSLILVLAFQEFFCVILLLILNDRLNTNIILVTATTAHIE